MALIQDIIHSLLVQQKYAKKSNVLCTPYALGALTMAVSQLYNLKNAFYASDWRKLIERVNESLYRFNKILWVINLSLINNQC